MISITLHLDGHCIETGAKNEFKRLMDLFFDGGDNDSAIEEKIAFLRDFIETADFKKLRAGDERLSGGTKITVEISRMRDTFKIIFQEGSQRRE